MAFALVAFIAVGLQAGCDGHGAVDADDGGRHDGSPDVQAVDGHGAVDAHDDGRHDGSPDVQAVDAAADVQAVDAAADAVPSVRAGAATLVGQLSGQTTALPHLNDTTTNHFYGGDLGTMWSDPEGNTRVAYGDSWTQPFTNGSAGPSGPGHICNAIFVSSTPVSNLSSAMTLTTPTGANTPTQIAPCGSNGNAGSIVPIGGVYVNGADYVRLTTITNLATGASNGSYVRKSTDGGRTWADVPGLAWADTGSDANFQYAAYANQGGYVYMFTTIVGRGGPLYLARVPAAQFETKSAYQYWSGLDWVPGDSRVAVPVIAGPVGEPSVQFDQALNLWLATYLDSDRYAVVLRYATSPAGPWSGEQVIFEGVNSPSGTSGMYGGFMHPGANATDLYIGVSEWNPYQVYLMHVPLTAGSGPLNLVTDGDFSDPSIGYANTNQGNPGLFGWSVLGYGRVDVGEGNGYRTPNEGYLFSNTSGFSDLFQTVAVQPAHEYTYTAWVRTSGTANAVYVGARNMAQTVHWENGPIGPLNGYTQLTVTFNSGSNSQVQVYAGMWVAAGVTTWLQLGQAQLVQNGL